MALNAKQSVLLRFALFMCVCFFTYGSYYVILFLQSSINIEGGLGATSATVTYTCSVVLGIFLTPVVIRVFGPKWTMILCQFGYLSYVLANFYPVSYLLIPAAILSGFAEASMWPVTILFTVHFARCRARYGSKEVSHYEIEYIGYVYMSLQLNQIFSNLLSYAILFGGASSLPNVSTSNTSLNNSSESSIANRLHDCGINDCQDPNITAANLGQYVPVSPTILYIMIGVMACLIVASIVIHAITTKPMVDKKQQEGENRNVETKSDTNTNQLIEPNNVTKSGDEDAVTIKGFSLCGMGVKQDPLTLAISAVKATGRHMICPRLLLIAPITIYCGLILSFGFAEMTRAYASCMIGVDQVGLCMATFAAAGAVLSVSITKLASRVGLNIPFAIGFVLDIGGYLLYLFWEPNEDNLWMVYVLFVVVGAVNGIWPPIVNEIHASFFPEDQDVAFTAWNVLFLLGIAIQYGWSTSLCVNVKIYIQIAILCISVLGYAFAFLLNKKISQERSN